MIVEIPDDNSIIKWKYKDTDDWTTTEILDLINAYAERRPKGEWSPCYENYKNGLFYRDCSICGKATMTGDWKFCPYCGAEMRGGTDMRKVAEDETN